MFVADEPLSAWNPPTYRVDQDGKVIGATPGTPNNWGRWGEFDQRGTLNHLTPDRVTAAASSIRDGRTFGLGVPIGHGVPYPGARAAPIHAFSSTTSDLLLGDPGKYSLQAADDFIVAGLQTLTQLDGLGHIAVDDVMYNGYWAGLVTASSGARRLGIHHLAQEGIVGRGVLLDVAKFEGKEVCAGEISVDELNEVVDHQGVTVRAGDILLIRTGVVNAWFNGDAGVFGRPIGLMEETIPWLAEHDVAMVGVDNSAVEAVQGLPLHPKVPFHHRAIKDLGLLLGEFLDLGALSDHCHETGRFDFFFVAQPLPFVNAVGSPIHPTAIT